MKLVTLAIHTAGTVVVLLYVFAFILVVVSPWLLVGVSDQDWALRHYFSPETHDKFAKGEWHPQGNTPVPTYEQLYKETQGMLAENRRFFFAIWALLILSLILTGLLLQAWRRARLKIVDAMGLTMRSSEPPTGENSSL